MNTRITARVRGVVQGVGYRYHVADVAAANGISGYVRNLPDGSVEVVAEGNREVLEDLVSHLWAGENSIIHVHRVDLGWDLASGGFSGFGIRY